MMRSRRLEYCEIVAGIVQLMHETTQQQETIRDEDAMRLAISLAKTSCSQLERRAQRLHIFHLEMNDVLFPNRSMNNITTKVLITHVVQVNKIILTRCVAELNIPKMPFYQWQPWSFKKCVKQGQQPNRVSLCAEIRVLDRANNQTQTNNWQMRVLNQPIFLFLHRCVCAKGRCRAEQDF